MIFLFQVDLDLGPASAHLFVQGVLCTCPVHPALRQHLVLLLPRLLPTNHPQEWQGALVRARRRILPRRSSDEDELQELQTLEVQGGRHGRGQGGQGGEEAGQGQGGQGQTCLGGGGDYSRAEGRNGGNGH